MEIIYLHGFLGSPSDFDFLRSEFSTKNIDLNLMIDASLEEIESKIIDSADSKPVLLGYSFGARMAVRLFTRSGAIEATC